MEKKKIILIRYALLIVAACIWGLAFTAQSEGMAYVKPFTFNAIRALIGALFLIPVSLVSDGIQKKKGAYKKLDANGKKNLLLGGLFCGLAISVAANLQQFGISFSTVAKSGFITTMYIVLVPVFGLFLGKKCHWIVWVSVALAVCGLFFICMNEEFTVATGDLLLIACAITFSVHILVIDRYADKADGIKMSCIQFFIMAFFSTVLALIFERDAFSWEAVRACLVPLLYTGIGSCGIAFTLQIIGQKDTNPTVSSLLMSTESCFSILGGFIFLQQLPTAREGIGCAIMFVAVILTQLQDVFVKKKKKKS